MERRSFLDRLESEQFSKNLIALLSTIFFLMILLLIVIFSRQDLNRVINLLYLLGGFILGLYGKGMIKNAT